MMDRLERRKKIKGLRLTDRDLDLFSYILDQKFLSLEQVYLKFFDSRKSSSDPKPEGFHVTRQRLNLLRQHGFLATERVYTESKSLYLLASKGYEVLKIKRPEDVHSPFASSVDFRQYEHDLRVTDCRIAFENTGRVVKWFSDRRIKREGFSSQYSSGELPKKVIPDGIVITKKGERVAFEFEMSQRQRQRFIDKAKSLDSVMYSKNPLLHKVIWIGSNEKIVSELKKAVDKGVFYKDSKKLFKVSEYDYFLETVRSQDRRGGVRNV